MAGMDMAGAQAFWMEVYGHWPLTQDEAANELHDWYVALQEVPKVYDEITGGRLTKPNTMAAYVLDAAGQEERGDTPRTAALEAVADVARQAVAVVRARGWWCKETRALAYAVEGEYCEVDRKHVPLPAWIFDADKHPPEGPAYYLLALKPGDGFPSIDGAHDDPAGVAKARKLYGAIAVVRPPEGTRYLMLTVQEAPGPGGSVNREAIDALNRMAGGGDG